MVHLTKRALLESISSQMVRLVEQFKGIWATRSESTGRQKVMALKERREIKVVDLESRGNPESDID